MISFILNGLTIFVTLWTVFIGLAVVTVGTINFIKKNWNNL